jgi:hypothetical protein
MCNRIKIGIVSYINMINELAGSGKRLSDKIMTLYNGIPE